MAITLDELLGRNTQQSQETYDRFPTYEEFHSQRAGSRNVAQENTHYDFEVRPMVEAMVAATLAMDGGQLG